MEGNKMYDLNRLLNFRILDYCCLQSLYIYGIIHFGYLVMKTIWVPDFYLVLFENKNSIS